MWRCDNFDHCTCFQKHMTWFVLWTEKMNAKQWCRCAASDVKMDRVRQPHRQQHQQHATRHDTSAPLDTTNSTDCPDVHVVFEFFTDNPQKTMPTDTNSPQKDSPYYDPYWDAIRSMQSNQNFLEGILLRCVDCSRKPSAVTICRTSSL